MDTEPVAHPLLGAIRRGLCDARNADGGWGARPGGPSETEVTALALMALAEHERESAGSALGWLVDRQADDGSWPLGSDAPAGSWATSLAVLALSGVDSERERARHGAEWLLGQQGTLLSRLIGRLQQVFLGGSGAADQDPTLFGWSWTPGTSSWVEPTSYALLAVKRMRRDLDAGRVASHVGEAERLLYDRMCVGGGWNYGNKRVLGEDLWPYPDVTAIALIALQDRADADANGQSIEALDRALAGNDSGLALGWSALCVELYGGDGAPLRERLAASFAERRYLRETRSLALAALALGSGAERLRVVS
jgi:hypothetical protein